MTWTQPVCENRFKEMYPDREPHRLIPQEGEEPDRCCYCGEPATIYVRLDPKTVPFPRVESDE